MISPILKLDFNPSIGQILTPGVHQSICNAMTAEWNGTSGVIFGSELDPYANKYNNVMSVINKGLKKLNEQMYEIGNKIFNKNRIKPILSIDDFNDVPNIMQYNILMYGPIRKLLEKDLIYGWGYTTDDLPEEDVVGRLIDNGKWDSITKQEYIEWKWESTDPILELEELDIIDETRRFFDSFIEEELAKDGERRDPTDLSFPKNKIGKLK